MKIFIQLIKTFSKKERLIFFGSFLIAIISFTILTVNWFFSKTIIVPAQGGEYVEGVIGQPSFINPLLAGENPTDRDLVKLIFSNLSDLAESYKMSEDGKTWEVRLKEGIFWQDGKPITSDDVIFTIKAIQDPDTHSSLFSNWQGVTAERISEREFKLTLPESYAFFEDTLKSLRLLPKHIFESLPAANFYLSDYNLEPIGSGPFKFNSFNKERSGLITEYQLIRNANYFGEKPYLEKIVFKFYQNEDELIKAFNAGAISGFGGLDPKNLSKINISHQVFELRLPRYYAIFLNPLAQSALKDKNVRLALNYAADRTDLVKKVFNGQAVIVNGPLFAGLKGYAPEVYPENNFSLEKAKAILEDSGWQLVDGVREKKTKKDLERLEFDLVVPEIPYLTETADLLSQNWAAIGVKLNLVIHSPQEVNDEFIKTRNYEMILFGNSLSSFSPDLSSFWHSSERFYPGLNLSLYNSKIADALIESIRKNLNEKGQERDLASLQSLIIQDQPAIFLYSPNYLYIAKTSLNGFLNEGLIISPSDRFENIEKWYVKTARVFK